MPGSLPVREGAYDTKITNEGYPCIISGSVVPWQVFLELFNLVYLVRSLSLLEWSTFGLNRKYQTRLKIFDSPSETKKTVFKPMTSVDIALKLFTAVIKTLLL